jgi:sugar (pentulose or hexulose) kinase
MYVIGLDVGTTGTKAVVIDEKGSICGSGYKEYELRSAPGGIVTQNAEDWWDAVCFAVKKAVSNVDDPENVRAIGLSTQGASMVPVDSSCHPLYDVMTWMDNRAVEEADYLDRTVGADEIYKKCGWRLAPWGDASKILWLKSNEPEVFAGASKFLSTVEFVNFRLTGHDVIDPTNAAIRQLFDISKADWDEDTLAAVGIGRDKLPNIVPTGECIGSLTAEAASALGLSTDVKVCCGAHDQYCASLGCGAVNEGDMLLATGTTWVVLGLTKAPMYTSSGIAPGIHPAGGYGAMASIVSAGSALKWYKGIIDGDFKTMDIEAEKRVDSARELFALPYVAGAGFPHNRPEVHGAMFGLDICHDKYDIARAMMEGVAFEAKSVLDCFADQGMNIKTLMMTGGASRSRLWSEIVGYITGCDIYRMQEPETCCVGAGMLAAVGSGMFSDFGECKKRMVKSEKLELPDSSMYAYYAEKEAKYKGLVSLVMKGN